MIKQHALIVEGGWATRHSVSDHMQTQARFFYYEDSPEILK